MRILAPLLILITLAPSAAAQRTTVSPQFERKLVSVVVQAEDSRTIASVSIQYGQAAWRPEYGKELEAPSASKYVQLGKGHWTSLDTMAPIEIAGARIEAGCWFLGLRIDAEGGAHLLIFDAVQAMRDGLLPGSTPLYTGDKKPIATAKLDLARGVAKEEAPLLVLEFTADERNARRAVFAIRWGDAVASAPVVLHVVGEGDAVRGRNEPVKRQSSPPATPSHRAVSDEAGPRSATSETFTHLTALCADTRKAWAALGRRPNATASAPPICRVRRT